VTERASAAAVAAIDHMSQAEALMALEVACPARKLLREAVHAYWQQKRRRRGAPLLRSLQAPTSTSDNNPYNVFRWVRWGWKGSSQQCTCIRLGFFEMPGN